MQLATWMEDSEHLIRTKLQYVYILSSAGFFRKAETNLRMLPKNHFTDELYLEYYMRYEQLNSFLNEYIDDNQFNSAIRQELYAYCDSVLMYLPANSTLSLLYEAQLAQGRGEPEVAFKYNWAYLKTLQPDTYEYAKAGYRLG